MEFGNALPYDINISGTGNKGFIVRVGCFTGAFTSVKTMLAAIEDYINDPKKMEKEYNNSNANRCPDAIEPDHPSISQLRTEPITNCTEERTR